MTIIIQLTIQHLAVEEDRQCLVEVARRTLPLQPVDA